MSSSFTPPSIDHLIEVERSDCKYNQGLVEIEGVVSGGNQGGWPHPKGYYVHAFAFAAWRRPGQPLIQTKLTILRPVDPNDAEKFSGFPEFSIHRMRVQLSEDETRAIFAGLSDHTPDNQGLREVSEELQKPVIVTSPRFGDLVLDRRINWFEGETLWNGQAVRITFDTDSSLDIKHGLAVAEQIWDHQREWQDKVENFAVQELLPLKNDSWLDEGETPLNPNDFKSRMTLKSISIHADGSFDFWHDDGDLFYGHSIQISGSIESGLTLADIPG